jgi:hypothetical protein
MANLYFVRLFHSLLSCGFCRRSVLVLSEAVLSETVLVLESRRPRRDPFSAVIDSAFIELKSKQVWMVALLSMI